MPVWSHADIAGKNIDDWIGKEENFRKEDLNSIFLNVRDAAYQIIERKGATYYGIAMGLVRLTKAILQNENSVLTVSAYLDGKYGHDDVYIGVPAIVNRNGIRDIIELDLNSEEIDQFTQSVNVLKKTLEPIRRD